jgi:butyryl-CoA dehydrogenase
LTEANAGSNAGGVETNALETRDRFIVNGTKIFVTNGGVFGTILVFTITEIPGKLNPASVFIVEKDNLVFSVGEIEDLFGMRANSVSSLFF